MLKAAVLYMFSYQAINQGRFFMTLLFAIGFENFSIFIVKDHGNAHRESCCVVLLICAHYCTSASRLKVASSDEGTFKERGFVRDTVIAVIEMLRGALMTGLVKLRCGVDHWHEGQVWAEVVCAQLNLASFAHIRFDASSSERQAKGSIHYVT